METPTEASVIEDLTKIYGPVVGNYWPTLKIRFPDFSSDQLAQQFKTEPTSEQSHWGREGNVRATARYISRRRGRFWRVLSAGCGHGPEPYELALEAVRLGSHNFHIDAVDVSPKAIEEAKTGRLEVYTGFSGDRSIFKNFEKSGVAIRIPDTKEDWRERSIYYQAREDIMPQLSFNVHDLINGPFLSNQESPYDIVICNNVLIHYPDHTRGKMFTNLLANMAKGSLLFLSEPCSGLIWSDSYRDWLKTLPQYGFRRDWVKTERLVMPVDVYRYIKPKALD